MKLVVREPESSALFEWLAARPERVSSAIARVEVLRALRRVGSPEAARRRAVEILTRLALVPIDRRVIEVAGDLDPADLRSLDAVHLATALSLGPDLGPVVTYDGRLAQAARRAGLEVEAPGA